MKAAIYARVSTGAQQKKQTIEPQIERLKTSAASRPQWNLSERHVYRDDGYSGAYLNRPGLDSLRDQAVMGAFEVVLITEPDRLAREYIHQLLLIDELEGHGCAVEFLDRPMSDDPHDRFLLQIRGAAAEYERSLIAERMRRGRRAKMKNGQLLPWTIAPFGYIQDTERPCDPARVRIDPAKAEIVKLIYAWYTDCQKSSSLQGIADRLNERHIATASGRALWSGPAVRNILRSETYAGTVYCNRVQSAPARLRRSPLEPTGSGRSRRQRPREDWIAVSVPATVSRETFDAARDRLSRNKKMSGRNNKSHQYLLRSMVSCAHCKLSCTARFVSPKYAYYICRGHQKGRNQCCDAAYIPSDILDKAVWEDLCLVLNTPELTVHELQRAQSGRHLPQALQAQRKSLGAASAQLERQQSRLLDAYLAEIISLDEFERKKQELTQTLEGLNHQLRLLDIQARKQIDAVLLSDNIKKFSERISQTLETLDFDSRRKLVELLIDRVIVYNGKVEIRYVIPASPKSENIFFCHLRKDYFRGNDGFKNPGPSCPRTRASRQRPAAIKLSGEAALGVSLSRATHQW
ncbi:MAG: recombinase family protein, partial [Gammaproteobacteria bacterium]|nr:recombinase family protein [Gammaproteobacteria bacterium]